jgi:hypothetical protein
LRISGCGDLAYGVIGIGEVVGRKLGDGVLERPGKGRQCDEEEKDRQSERTKAHVKKSEHWTTPAGEVEKAVLTAFSDLGLASLYRLVRIG